MQPVKIRFAYRKGFRRLFFLLAAAWLVFGVSVGWDDKNFWGEFLSVGIAPIIVLYVFGVVCVWIIEGFVRADR